MGRLDVSDETGDLSNYSQVLDVWKRQACVCIFAACDVDGHMAAQSLTGLLRREGLAYSLVYVSGFSDLQRELDAQVSRLQLQTQESLGGVSGVLLNCGAVADLTRLAAISQDFQVFVFDAHRPIHPGNLRSRHVFVLDKDADFSQYGQENVEPPSPKRPRLREETEEDDDDAGGPEYMAEPTTLLVHEMRHACRAEGELWNVAVAIASYKLIGKYSLQKYLTVAHALDQQYLASREDMEISFQSELALPLYRYYSLHGALAISAYVYGKLKLNRDYGKRKLLQILAYAGIPMDQSNQLFISMALPVKLKLKNGKFADACRQFDLDDIAMHDFVLRKSPHEELCAGDVALAMMTALADRRVLETSDAERRATAVTWLRDVATQTKMVLDRRASKIKRQVRFIKIEQPAAKSIAENVLVARLLGVFLATVFYSRPDDHEDSGTGAKNPHKQYPLVLAIKTSDASSYRVLAVDIWASDSQFSRDFRLAAMEAGTQIQADLFDTETVQVPVADFDKWSNTLFTLLGDADNSEISYDSAGDEDDCGLKKTMQDAEEEEEVLPEI